MATTYIPEGLRTAATHYAHARARREPTNTIFVYARGGVVFVRADYEPAPEGAEIINTINGNQ